MGLDFKLKDFAYPLSILRLKTTFDRNQWLQEDKLYEYQLRRLKLIIEHAYRNVPYYNRIFKEKGITPGDIRSLDNLKILPFLTKDILRSSFKDLVAKNASAYKPQLLSTSGTTGGAVKFYVDRPSNILEFVFYWRFWGWAGYRLGDTFAELSAQFFTPYEKNVESFYHFEHLTRRLMVNSLLISSKNTKKIIEIFKRFKPRFLKGLPSNLYMLAWILRDIKDHGISFKAIFSQGENLLEYQRSMVEDVFSCKILDFYGHMERTVAISQCPQKSYHVHLDYGIAEFEKVNRYSNEGHGKVSYIAEIVGTGLHNFSMPLIRYKTEDLVEINCVPEHCLCHRGFPTILSIHGRTADAIVTPDKRAITALYVALDRTPGIDLGQIIQETSNRIVVRVASSSTSFDKIDNLLIKNLRDFVGDSMDIKIVHDTVARIRGEDPEKFKVVISRIVPDAI